MNKKFTIITGVIAVIVILGTGLYSYQEKAGKTPDIEETSVTDGSVITYNGKKYKYNTDLNSILFLGVDKSGTTDSESEEGSGGQADTIILYVMNREDKTAKIIQIPRDTMVQVKQYDISGRHISDEKAQIALQYAYGDNPQRSSILMKEAASELFYGVKIEHYATMYVEGIEPVVDALGGVTLTVPEDYTRIDPDFVKGREITLDGKNAERYVRYRDLNVQGSNLERMERQTQFVRALLDKAGAEGEESEGLQRLLDACGDYFLADMNIPELAESLKYKMDEKMITIPGEMKTGDDHDEFYTDDEKLLKILLSVFFEPVEK